MSEDPHKPTHWFTFFAFVLFWTSVSLVVLYFVAGTPHRPDAMAVVFAGMIGSGYFLTWRSGHLPPKRFPKI
jgi:hypothetical protein